MSDDTDAKAYPVKVTYVDGVPKYIKTEARDDGSNNPEFATYGFEIETDDMTARLTEIQYEKAAYGVTRHREARAEVREAVEALPFVQSVVMFGDE